MSIKTITLTAEKVSTSSFKYEKVNDKKWVFETAKKNIFVPVNETIKEKIKDFPKIQVYTSGEGEEFLWLKQSNKLNLFNGNEMTRTLIVAPEIEENGKNFIDEVPNFEISKCKVQIVYADSSTDKDKPFINVNAIYVEKGAEISVFKATYFDDVDDFDFNADDFKQVSLTAGNTIALNEEIALPFD